MEDVIVATEIVPVQASICWFPFNGNLSINVLKKSCFYVMSPYKGMYNFPNQQKNGE